MASFGMAEALRPRPTVAHAAPVQRPQLRSARPNLSTARAASIGSDSVHVSREDVAEHHISSPKVEGDVPGAVVKLIGDVRDRFESNTAPAAKAKMRTKLPVAAEHPQLKGLALDDASIFVPGKRINGAPVVSASPGDYEAVFANKPARSTGKILYQRSAASQAAHRHTLRVASRALSPQQQALLIAFKRALKI